MLYQAEASSFKEPPQSEIAEVRHDCAPRGPDISGNSATPFSYGYKKLSSI